MSLPKTSVDTGELSPVLDKEIARHPEFEEIGNRMLQQWEQGIALSLKAAWTQAGEGLYFDCPSDTMQRREINLPTLADGPFGYICGY